MSQAEQGRNEVVIYRLEKARTTLKEAKDNIIFKSWSLIANRLFYAAYYAVSGLLIVYGHRVKSHEGTVSQFGQYFVKEGLFPPETGRFYHQLFEKRLTGDYEDNYDLTEEDVMPLFEPTEQLIVEVTAMAKQAMASEQLKE